MKSRGLLEVGSDGYGGVSGMRVNGYGWMGVVCISGRKGFFYW